MARHKGVSKARWLEAQKSLSERWQQEDLLTEEQERVQRCYLPLITRHLPDIDKTTRILDLCCGPVCAAQIIKEGTKSYLDPMLDAYRRMYPGKLPKGRHMSLAAEKVPEDDASFEVILCINGLDHVLNPELTLNEMERLLKPSGTLIIGLSVLPAPMARMRYFFERFFSPLRDEAHPYSYTLPALERSLARHFEIIESLELEERCCAETRSMASEYVFICRRKSLSVVEEPTPDAGQ